jgi:hypothetical protein
MELNAGLARPLPITRGEKLVVRAAVLSIALTLAVGPTATLLCSVWCHGEEATTPACQHPGTITSPVIAENSCRTTPAVAIAFVRDEAKRGPLTSGAQQPVVIPPFLFVPQPSDTGRIHDTSAPLDGGIRLPLIALRI